MRKQAVTPIHLDRLPMIRVIYVLQNFETVAIQCVPETIGAMSIEFGVEVETQQSYRWLTVILERNDHTKDKPVIISRKISLGDWLVVLEDEVHIFPNDVFHYTFALAKEASHLSVPEEQPATTFMSLPADLQHQDSLPPLPPEIPQIH